MNGNLLSDANKGISSITYNHLNLPTSIIFNGSSSQKIEYFYDANGMKLRKEIPNKITDYAGNFVYEKIGSSANELQFFSTPEGYVSYDNGQFNYVYNYVDHLGNVRLSYTDANQNNGNPVDLQIVQEKNYYPFGLTHQGYNGGGSSLGNDAAKRYGFGGKELQDESFSGNTLDWYDFGARNYNPDLGRWMNLDPKAADYFNFSPYNYTFDNPIIFVDPDGMRVEWAEDLDKDEKELLGYAIYFLRKNSKSFNQEFEELHSSKRIFRVGTHKGGSAIGLFDRPRTIMEEEGKEGGNETFSKLRFRYDTNENSNGGKISVDLNEIKINSKLFSSQGVTPLSETLNILPEEFSGAATFLYYSEIANGYLDEMPAAANIEYETKMLSGIILNEAGLNLSRGKSQLKVEQFGIDFSKGEKTYENYFNAFKEWHTNPNTAKYYRNLSRNSKKPLYTKKISN